MKTKPVKYKVAFVLVLLIASLISSYLHYQIKNKPTTIANEDLASNARFFIQLYRPIALTANLSSLSSQQKQMLPHLVAACKKMDGLYWQQNWGSPYSFGGMVATPSQKQLLALNYGPWEKAMNNQTFLPGIEKKSKGGSFYPEGLTQKEFDLTPVQGKNSPYSILYRDAVGNLQAKFYSILFQDSLKQVQVHLSKAEKLAEHQGFKNYLKLVSASLTKDDYYQSDLAWVKLKGNPLDLIIGPIESYEDDLFGIKTSFEGLLLLREPYWTKYLESFTSILPQLQNSLPVPKGVELPLPTWDPGMGVYSAILHCGQANTGIKAIAINLPNDPKVQSQAGTRSLQLKNVMEAKFKLMMQPLAKALVHPAQNHLVTFEAFFENTLFHEVAHGLGSKTTNQGLPHAKAFGASTMELEEGKADVLSLYLLSNIKNSGKVTSSILEQYVTFVTGMVRTIRFGVNSAHGRAALIRWNYLFERQAFIVTNQGIMVHRENMQRAVASLTKDLLKLQSLGSEKEYQSFAQDKKSMGPSLRFLLKKSKAANIPIDIYFKQGPKYWNFNKKDI